MQLSYCRRVLVVASTSLMLVAAGCGGGGGGGDVKPQPINTPPSVTIVQPDRNPIDMDVKSAQFVDLTIKTADPDGGKLHCVWAWDAGAVTPSEQDAEAGYEMTVRFTPPSYDGTCHVKATISDGLAVAEAEFTIQVTGNNVQPSGELRITDLDVNPIPMSPSQQATITATVENPENKQLTYKWDSKAGSISGTGNTATCTVTDHPGIYGVYLTVSDGTQTVVFGKAVTVAGPGGGLNGEYYKTKRVKGIVQFDQLAMTRVDPTINLLWEQLSPDPSHLPSEGWGARWTGFIKCEQPGTYVFRVHVDDGARMKIQNDNGEWVDAIPGSDYNWSDHNRGAWLPRDGELVSVQLQGGKWYPVELDFFQGGSNAFITLYWSVNGGTETEIQQTDLKPT